MYRRSLAIALAVLGLGLALRLPADRDLAEPIISGAVWFDVLARLAGGRALLALLPPGDPGSHAPRHLATTLGWSWLLGTVFASHLPTAPFAGPFAALGAAAFTWLGPARFLPRHVRILGTPRGADHLLWIAPIAAGALAAGNGLAPLDAAAVAAALAIAPGARLRAKPVVPLALAVLGVSLALQPLAAPTIAILTLAAASAWFTRADRRALALAAVGVAGLAVCGSPWSAASLLLAAWVAAAPAARGRVAIQGLVAIGAGSALAALA